MPKVLDFLVSKKNIFVLRNSNIKLKLDGPTNTLIELCFTKVHYYVSAQIFFGTKMFALSRVRTVGLPPVFSSNPALAKVIKRMLNLFDTSVQIWHISSATLFSSIFSSCQFIFQLEFHLSLRLWGGHKKVFTFYAFSPDYYNKLAERCESLAAVCCSSSCSK